MKKYFLLLISMLVFSMFALDVNAQSLISCTADIPSYVTIGTELNASFNATLVVNDGNDRRNFTDIFVAFEVRSVSTANSSFSLIGNVSNTTALNHTNMTIPNVGILNLEPSNDYEVRATCYALTSLTGPAGVNVTVATTVTGVTFDLGDRPSIPTTAHAKDKEFTDVSGSNIITYTVNGANTTNCRIAFLQDGASPRFSGSNTFAMTHSGNSCTYTITKGSLPDSSYDVYVRASDFTNTTNSNKIQFKINTMEGDVGGGGISAFGDGEVDIAVARGIASNDFVTLIIIIVVVAGAWYYMNNSGSGRKN